MKTIAFLGLGAMGSRMVANLLKAGYDVTVWNRSPERVSAMAALGAKVAATPRDAVRAADAVVSMVRDDDASRDVWLDEGNGALTAMQSNALALECSTLTVQWVKTLAQAAQAQGIRFLDAPVAGSRPQAEAAQLIFIVGGTTDDLSAANDLLRAMGSAVHHVGESGAGAAVKLLVNSLFAAQVAVMGELLGVAGKLGVDPQRALDVMAATPTLSPAARGAGLGVIARNFSPMFPVELVQKDIGYALREAHAVGAKLPMIDAVSEVLGAAADAGYAEQNLTALARLYL
jgi:3-hydroxyisobutyrate dehydrogenase